MTELNGKEMAAARREYVGPDQMEQGDPTGYKIAPLSPQQVDIVRTVEDLLSLISGRRVVLVVYEPSAAAGELDDDKQQSRATEHLQNITTELTTQR